MTRRVGVSLTRGVIRKRWHRCSLPNSLLVGACPHLRRGVSAGGHEATQSCSTSPPSGNQVDGSPLDNGKPMQNIIELTMFCIMIEEKSPRISCPEYMKDLDKYVKRLTRQCQRQIHDISKFLKFEKSPILRKIIDFFENLTFSRLEGEIRNV